MQNHAPNPLTAVSACTNRRHRRLAAKRRRAAVTDPARLAYAHREARRESRRAAGVCPWCGYPPHVGDHAACAVRA